MNCKKLKLTVDDLLDFRDAAQDLTKGLDTLLMLWDEYEKYGSSDRKRLDVIVKKIIEGLRPE